MTFLTPALSPGYVFQKKTAARNGRTAASLPPIGQRQTDPLELQCRRIEVWATNHADANVFFTPRPGVSKKSAIEGHNVYTDEKAVIFQKSLSLFENW